METAYGINCIDYCDNNSVISKKISNPSFSSDVAPFIEFLKNIQDGTIVLMATYDDGATKYVNLQPNSFWSFYLPFKKQYIFTQRQNLFT